MIKSEIIAKQQKSKVCFNPCCPSSQCRIFAANDAHSYNISCLNWIIDLKSHDFSQIKDKSEIVFNFGGMPFKDNINSCQLITAINLQFYFQVLKKELIQSFSQQLDNMFSRLDSKYNFIPATQLLMELQYMSASLDDPNCHQKVQQLIQKCLKPCENTQITLKIPLKEQLIYELNRITYLQSKFYSQNQYNNVSQNKAITFEQSEKIRNFIFQQNSGSFNKLQQIASICGQRMENIKVYGGSINISCPFCDFKVVKKITNTHGIAIKQMKKDISLQILQHCYQGHSDKLIDYILPKIQPGIGKKDKKRIQISYQNFYNDIKEHTKLRVIDRQSGLPYKNPPADAYCIEVLSKTNQNMSKIRHILTEDRKVTQFMIYFIILEVCYFRKIININDVALESNSCSLDRVKEIAKIIKNVEFNSQHCGGMRIEKTIEFSLEKQKTILKKQINEPKKEINNDNFRVKLEF